MDVSFGNMRVKLNVFNASNQPQKDEEQDCFLINVIDEMIEYALSVHMFK